jgi:hypothetical protein
VAICDARTAEVAIKRDPTALEEFRSHQFFGDLSHAVSTELLILHFKTILKLLNEADDDGRLSLLRRCPNTAE